MLLQRKQLTCGSCAVCEEPDAIDGVSVIFQAKAVSDTLAAVWLKSEIAVAGVQAETKCKSRLFFLFSFSPSLSSFFF